MKTILSFILKFILYLFSIALALGAWNPLMPYNPDQASVEGSNVYQFITIFLVGIIAFVPYKTKIVYIRYKKELILFSCIILLSTLFYSISYLDVRAIIYFIKLLLVILLCILLPPIFAHKPSSLYFSLLLYSLICAIISLLYTRGMLNEYIVISKGRVFFWGENPNSTSARYAMAFLCIIHLIIKNPLNLGKYRHIMWLFLPPIFNMVMASGSRGSFLIMLICVLIYFVYIPTKNRIIKCLLLIIFPIMLYQTTIYFLSHNYQYSLIQRINDSIETGDEAGRDNLQKESIDIFCDYPIIGTGVIKYQEEMINRYNEKRTVHNLFFYVLVTSGFLGFIPFMIFIVKLIQKSFLIRKQEPIALILLIYMLLLAWKTGGILTYTLMWYVFAIVIALVNNEFSIKEQYKNSFMQNDIV